MKTILQLNTSLNSSQGLSSHLAGQYVAAWLDANPRGQVVVRDLAANPVPHLTAERFGAFTAKAGERTDEQAQAVALSDQLIEELRRADTIAIGLPMYNFGIPSTLKAYFDHVARAGVTFRYGTTGPEGLLKGKKAVIFATRGGVYAGTPGDTETAYVRMFLGFLGITDVEFVYAEGIAMGRKDEALAKAGSEIARIAANGEVARLAA